MPITKDINGVITESEPHDLQQALRTGVWEKDDFAVSDRDDHIKQMKLDPSEQATDTTVTLKSQPLTSGEVKLPNEANPTLASATDISGINTRLQVVEGKYVRSTRFASISAGTSGSITLPTNSSVVLDDFGGTVGAVVSTISGGRPAFLHATDSVGTPISATFDVSGNWALSGTPSAYPVALIYRVQQTLANFTSTDSDICGIPTNDEVGSGSGGGGVAVSAGTGLATSGTVKLVDSNGISFLSGTQGVYASYTVPNVPAQTAYVFSAANGATFGTNGSTVTMSYTVPNVPAQTNQTLGMYGVGNTTGQSSSSTFDARSLSFQGAGVASVGMSGGSVVISVPSGGGAGDGGNILAAGGSTANSTGTVVFSNSNGLAFGLNGATITGSYTVPTQTQFVLSNSNGISFGTNGSTVTASYTVPTQTVQPVAYSAGNGSAAFSTLKFADSQGVSWSTGTQGIFATVKTDYQSSNANYLTSQSNQAAQGSNGSFTFQTLSFSNANGMSFGTSAGSAITASYTVPTVPAQTNQTLGLYAVSNTTGQSSSTTVDARTLSFHGAGIASVGYSGGSVVISVPAGGGAGDGANIMAAGTQTANTTGTVLFQNSNGVTFGMSNNSVITASVNAGGGALPTMSIYPWPINDIAFSTNVSNTTGATGGSFQSSAHFRIAPLVVPYNVSYNDWEVAISGNTVAGTGSCTAGICVGIYSLNAETAFSLVDSAVWNIIANQNSVTAQSRTWWWGTNSTSNSGGTNGNVSASFTGARRIDIRDTGTSLSAGQYYIAMCHTMRSSGSAILNISSLGMISGSQTVLGSYYGANAVPRYFGKGQIGVFSSTFNDANSLVPIMPTSIHTSAVTASGGTSQWGIPWTMLYF